MRWPWQRRERRDSGGDFSDAVVRLIEAQAVGTVADASSTVAVEAASGALSRAFASPGVVGAAWVQECLSPAVLAQMARDLIRSVVRRRILTPWTPTMSIGWHADRRRIRRPNNTAPSFQGSLLATRAAWPSDWYDQGRPAYPASLFPRGERIRSGNVIGHGSASNSDRR